MARNYRKQRVSLRFKRREHLKHRVRTVMLRSVLFALVVGFGAGLVTGGDSFVSRFIHRHTPQVDLDLPPMLAGLPAAAELPKNSFWLWFPGSGTWLEKRIGKKYLSVRAVRVDRQYQANRVTVHVEPRLPLVSWHGAGFDRDGVLFAITPGAWKTLPQADFLATARKEDLSRWLAQMAIIPELWPEVISIRQLPSETIELTLKSGVEVIWGPIENGPAEHKAQMLARVLDDAHKNMSGAARADLRFFDQGRIIVLPKGR